MNTNLTVAVLMTTYNGEKFLKQQLDSILSQTYQNYKLYISDDNSSDSTVQIISKYQNNHPDKIFYKVNQNNIGFVENFENLIAQSDENYMALSDQDDIWRSDKLELEMQEMLAFEKVDKNRAYLVHSDLSMIDEKGKLLNSSYFKYRNYSLKNTKDLGHILGPCGVMGNTLLLNKKLKNLILPFPDNLDVHDYWIALNCELFGTRKTLNTPLVQYRIHQNNSSNSTNILTKNSFLKLNRDIKLPNIETNREYFLIDLYKKIENEDDLKILDAYMDYLELKKSRVGIYFNLIKYSLVKRDTLFRIKLFMKIVVSNRYN